MDMPTFNELKELAQRDPEGFEVFRAALIEDCIRRSSVSNQRRLRGLQFVIEALLFQQRPLNHRHRKTHESCTFDGPSPLWISGSRLSYPPVFSAYWSC